MGTFGVATITYFTTKYYLVKVAIYGTHKFEKGILEKANAGGHTLVFIEPRLTPETAVLSEGCDAVCLFVSDQANAQVLTQLHTQGIRFIAMRCAGYNNVDLGRAAALGIRIARVPAYSPYAVAEHAVALMLGLNRKLVRAHNRVMDLNFALDGLTGFDMNGKTAGIAGTGKIGAAVARILHGFGCRLVLYDKYQDAQLVTNYGAEYTSFESLCNQSDIITLHLPLLPDTKYIVNSASIANMKPGVMLVNTSRGALVNTNDVVTALKSGQIGYFGMDVYEEEEGLFFEDHSDEILQDDTIARLMAFKNVLITSHQAFLTDTALNNIATTTFFNLGCFANNAPCNNEIGAK